MMHIQRVAVLGGGVMGASIAAHLANARLEVLLLDLPPKDLTGGEEAKGLTLESPEVRNRLANAGLQNAIKEKPAPFYLKKYSSLIEVGNFEDHMAKIRDCQWVVEAVLENMEVKKRLFSERVASHLAEGTILSTNTSGLSVNEMAASLPEVHRKNFLCAHFFNPPRYMRLMELIPCRETDPKTLSFMAEFIRKHLGKGIVHAKDTPNFIGNRIGVYSVFNCIRHMLAMDLTVEEVDSVAGPATARAKSAAFRTADLVGLDTLVHIAHHTHQLLPDDDERDIFVSPEFLVKMVEGGLLGTKAGRGFYRKEKGGDGSQLFFYDYQSGDYQPLAKSKFPSVQAGKTLDDPRERLKAIIAGKDKGAEFAWKNLRDTLLYAVKRIPEISEDVVNVDNAMKWGFNWEMGPFEMLDAMGVADFVRRAQGDGVAVPDSLTKIEHFYKIEEGRKFYWDLPRGEYAAVETPPHQLDLEIIKSAGGVVEKNAGSSILDLGDGVFCLEFHSKMNAIGGDALAMTLKAVKRAEEEGVGLVVGNRGVHFSAGANLMMISVAMAEGAFEDIDLMIRRFQKATLALKYSRVPVVAAPFNMTLGGGCEFTLHADAINAFAETYMGLVEVGVGLLPAGGGTKEMALRAVAAAERFETDVTPYIFKYFKNIGMAKVSTSAAELFDMGYMREGDSITMDFDGLFADAKAKVLALTRNYRPSKPVENMKAPGRGIAAGIKSQLWNMGKGGFATEYEVEMGGIIAHVITGGDVPPGTLITEHYLLELEREAFLKLCGNKKTQERILHMLKKGKPLRN